MYLWRVTFNTLIIHYCSEHLSWFRWCADTAGLRCCTDSAEWVFDVILMLLWFVDVIMVFCWCYFDVTFAAICCYCDVMLIVFSMFCLMRFDVILSSIDLRSFMLFRSNLNDMMMLFWCCFDVFWCHFVVCDVVLMFFLCVLMSFWCYFDVICCFAALRWRFPCGLPACVRLVQAIPGIAPG